MFSNSAAPADILRKTSFDEQKTVARYAQIELKSAIDQISTIRNVVTTTNGTVTVATSGEYKVSTTANASAISQLQSGERGRYIPGYEAECGIGVRIPDQTWAGTSKVEWGYFDTDDGFGYGVDSGGVYIWIKRSTTVTKKIYQSNWNTDSLDGTSDAKNPSGYTLDLSVGLVTQVEFIWYGYGSISWYINIKDDTKPRGSFNVLVHSEVPNNQTSVSQPNLPITVRIENGTDATAKDVYVGGRQFSIYGQPTAKYRINGERRTSISIGAGAWTPVISFRRKTGRGNNQSVQISDIDLIVGENMFFTFFSGGTLNTPSWGALTDVPTTETVLEKDVSSTTITGGVPVGGIHLATSASGASDNLITLENLDFDFVGSNPVTLACRTVDGTTGTVTAASFNASEQW